ncbi:MAG: 16S rRNA (guanine(966)-N(2))-methyltransferase RsmD [Flavobacteriales bacterium]|nr:16S rRNA (guanine(966)-N(2))-methyltransferase RsmD [Flavobacteriales bacterium]|tara:strand:- start:163 stop:699 length:537 start_codon:yes stop_codon:yes gene_type:complete
MRIISGLYKNRKINFQKLHARPTTDFAKESLFNLLRNDYIFEHTCALDLFAGTGNISYEFCSRGVRKITAVDNNRKCIDFIKKIKLLLNLTMLDIVFSDTMRYLKRNQEDYDVIFADPPYNYTQIEYEKIIELILNKKLIKEHGTLIIEHSKFINFTKHDNLYLTKKYGSVNFSFFKI